eukprot:TRINITY_DN4997_c1_g1_i1.p1 TRINITY_DN4997_c1_g1~~TRINITY_DN4997_c1_g1_i1.p1  ORF type:complete len:173 (-),score=25.97 TRINITY_DN4997_c1_g1_i1:208-726(-)
MSQVIADSDIGRDNALGSGEKDTIDHCGSAVAEPKIHDVLADLTTHYDCSACILALRRTTCLQVLALDRERHLAFEEEVPLIDEEQFQLFHHHVRRPLPTIIDDAAQDKRVKNDPHVVGNPHVRFYAAAPIYSSSRECLGTLCIVDKLPRTCFTLNDASYLCDLAALMAKLV